jgi:hypothetical protein
MDETDVFFTHTIVGAPFSVLMGRRLRAADLRLQGLDIDPQTGRARLSDRWHDSWVLSHDGDPPGRPRPRPGKVRRLLERHALWMAVSGMVLWLGAGAFWWVTLWR